MITAAALGGVAVVLGGQPAAAVEEPETPASYINVGNIYKNSLNMQTLYNLIAGADHTSLTQINELAKDGYNAAAMRAQTFGKLADQDIVVELGQDITGNPLRWQVCYLSKDINDNPILTLWAVDPITPVEVTWGNNIDYEHSDLRDYLMQIGESEADAEIANLLSFLRADAELVITPNQVQW